MKTIATFSDELSANLARARLASVGIDSFLDGAQSVSMAWHLTIALGGIKLQVSDHDADEAATVLAEVPEDPTEAEEATETQSEQDAATGPITLDYEGIPDEFETLSNREQTADRALRGVLLSMFLFPVHLYIFWLLLKVFISSERLHGRHRRNAIIAAVINLPCVFMIATFCKDWLYRM